MKISSALLKKFFGVLLFLFTIFVMTGLSLGLVNFPYIFWPFFAVYILLNIGVVILYCKKDISWLRRVHLLYMSILIVAYTTTCIIEMNVYDVFKVSSVFIQGAYAISAYFSYPFIVAAVILTSERDNLSITIMHIIFAAFILLMGTIMLLCRRYFEKKKAKTACK